MEQSTPSTRSDSIRLHLAQIKEELSAFDYLSMVPEPEVDDLLRHGAVPVDLVFGDGRKLDVIAEVSLLDDGLPRLVLSSKQGTDIGIGVVFGAPAER